MNFAIHINYFDKTQNKFIGPNLLYILLLSVVEFSGTVSFSVYPLAFVISPAVGVQKVTVSISDSIWTRVPSID